VSSQSESKGSKDLDQDKIVIFLPDAKEEREEENFFMAQFQRGRFVNGCLIA
jgi:hypothetical protein